MAAQTQKFRNIDVGYPTGVAGTIDVYPGTEAKGKLQIAATANTGDTTVTLTNAAMGQATTITIPDPGASTGFLGVSTAALSQSELDVLDGVTAGTVTASKALVVGANKNIDSLMFSEAANTTSVRNGTSAQKFVVYNTINGADYERGGFTWTSNILRIGTELAGGAGSQRDVIIQRNGTSYITIGSSNISFADDLVFGTDNALDIGAVGATRPRTGYFGTSVVSPAYGAGGVASTSTFINIAASTTANSALRFVQGVAPTSPVDGDMWREDNTNTGLKVRINGVTKTVTVS
jgi:hypothetical protein